MSSEPCRHWSAKSSVVFSIASLAAVIVLNTPLPEMDFVSCDRPCHELDWPMICRFKLNLEVHQVMGGWCGDCPHNASDCSRPGCIVGDGQLRRVMAVNKMLPGPSIQVCEKDILVIDVVNKIPGQSVAIHWRGQHQRESPYMDGVPMITQCPISSYTTFQYKFRAAQAGTHLWHAQSGNELLDGLFGAIVVRRPDKMEQHRSLYDVDDRDHVLVINEWGNIDPVVPFGKEKSRILINGISYHEGGILPRMIVAEDVRFRIRVAHAGGGLGCPVYLTIQEHSMLVIYMDGKPIVPREVTTLKIAPGERTDFVLTADQSPDSYWLKAYSNCTDSIGLVKVVYNATIGLTDDLVEDVSVENNGETEVKVLSTVLEDKCRQKETHIVCLPHIGSLNKLPENLHKVDTQLYLPFDYVIRAPHTSARIGDIAPRMNNITFVFPPSPILSQPYDLSSDLICQGDKKPTRCQESRICECVHVIEIPFGSSAEIVLIDREKTPSSEHVFHLHGHSFYVVGIVEGLADMTMESIKLLDSKGLLMHRNLKNPVQKDTISIPRGGAVALRFFADNPGYWLLHDQSTSLWAKGLDVVFKVGEPRDLPTAPPNFPQCGSWVGPDFFLI